MQKLIILLPLQLLLSRFEPCAPFSFTKMWQDQPALGERIGAVYLLSRKSAATANCLVSIPSMSIRIDAAAVPYLNRAYEILGADPEPGEVGTTGILSILIHAYHTRMIADERVLNWVALSTIQEKHEERARRLRGEADLLWRAQAHCAPRPEWNIPSLTFVQKVTESFRLHQLQEPHPYCFDPKTRKIARKSTLEDLIWNAYAYAMSMLSVTLDVSNRFDEYSVDGRVSGVTSSSFKLMLEDSLKSESSIEKSFSELKGRLARAIRNDDQPNIAFYSEKLKYFEDKRKSSHYPYLFTSSEIATATFGNRSLAQARLEAFEEFKVATMKCYDYYVNAAQQGYLKEDNLVNQIIKKEAPDWEETLWKPVTQFFYKHLHVSTQRSDPSPSLFSDGTFEFDLKKPLQNMRVAQDLLDQFDEEMKCYLKRSYWLDLVNGTVDGMQKQFETKQIFSHWSKTLFQLCETTETDLIGACTVENHEICTPALPSERQQTHINEHQDSSYYKPKWVFTRQEWSPSNFTCEGERTHIIPVNLCRCGVRMDCGSDIGENITCVLVENDDVRRQCKGSIGYPCKSLPLAPGRHDESCVTGYCDMVENMCAEDPRSYERFV